MSGAGARPTLGRDMCVGLLRAALVVSLASLALLPAAAATAESGDVGFRGHVYTGGGGEPAASKPESKLWWHDGAWWGSMWDGAGSFRIFRLDREQQVWSNTGVALDNRAGTRADTLADGNRLYVASHGYTDSGKSTASVFRSRLYRFTYDPARATYVPDAGFPVTIGDYKTETLVIDKDSSGTLWATWTQDSRVYVNRTLEDDRTWGVPFVLPVPGASDLDPDDISSVVAFSGRVGVMWSNQRDSAMYFATHTDGARPDDWSQEVALDGTGNADDHVNLKADDAGRVYAAVKTSRLDSTAPLTLLLVRAPGTGHWSSHTFGLVRDHHTRPIVVLDEANDVVHMLATSGEKGGTIYLKSSATDSIAFAPGLGRPFISDATSASMNNATSTKQRITAASGLVVLANHNVSGHYWHNHYPPEAPAPPPPVSSMLTVTANADTYVKSGYPTKNFGKQTTLRLRNGGSTSNHDRPYLQFVVATGGATVVSARLRLTVTDTGSDGGSVYLVADDWTETDVTWDNAPAIGGSPVASIGPVTAGETVDVPLAPSLLAAGGVYSFALTTTTSDDAWYASRETATPPQLIVGLASSSAPSADFDAAPRTGHAPLTVAFTDRSSGPVTSRTWDFGDGALSAETNPNHTFARAGAYTVSLTVVGPDGTTSTKTDDVTVTESPTGSTVALTAVADTYVKSGYPTKNFGTQVTLRLRNGGESSNHDRPYLKFVVPSLDGTIVSAKLRLTVTDTSPDGGSVFHVENDWTETAVTWGTAPAIARDSVASIGPVSAGEMVEVSLPASLLAAGTYSFALTTTTSNDAWYASRETSTPPQLILLVS
jgi:PKD repeat protein